MKKALTFMVCFCMLFIVTAAYAGNVESSEKPCDQCCCDTCDQCGCDTCDQCGCDTCDKCCCDTCDKCCCDTCDKCCCDCCKKTYRVTYLPNNCLAAVPTDKNCYAGGDLVNVLFDPVAYKDYLIFYGWDINNDGVADFGYNYNTFTMPEADVTLKAICIPAWSGSSCSSCCGPCGCGRSCGVNNRDFYGGNYIYKNFPNHNLWPYVW